MIGNIDEDNVKLIHDSNDAKRFQTSTLGWITLHSQDMVTYHKVSCIKIDPCSKVLPINYLANIEFVCISRIVIDLVYMY
jgi:hypothetical protein